MVWTVFKRLLYVRSTLLDITLFLGDVMELKQNSLLYNIAKLVLITGLSQFHLACILDENAGKDISDAFDPAPVPDPEPVQDNQLCYSDSFIQPEADISKKIDILFVVDTSGSLSAERAGIADGIDAFVQELPGDVDYNVSVMLAHGSQSAYGGQLYAYSSNPKVLKSSELTQDDIRVKLRENMTKIKGEPATDGGEVGLSSLMSGITTNLDANKAHGFFRDDAALAVVFVADENDICSLSQYPEGVDPVYDPNLKEWPAHDAECDGINPVSVTEELKALKQDIPVLVSGIIYTNPETIVSGGENEIGYGYLGTIQQANGVAIDLANGDYDLGMRDIGYLAVKKLNLLTEFPLSNSGFDQSTLKVLVDQQSVSYTYQSNVNEIHIDVMDAGGEKSLVYISYCLPMSDPVIISNIMFLEANTTSFIVQWNTDVPSPSQVEYTNVLTGQVSLTTLDPSFVLFHGSEASGLSPDTLYDIRIIAFNDAAEPFYSDFIKVRTLP